MKKHLFPSILIGCLTAAPALALQVTNLDKIPHKVAFDRTGSREEFTLQPDESKYIVGEPDGKLSLVTQHPKPNNGNLHADGMLSGIVGVARDQEIPTDDGDEYAIWPGGELILQHRKNMYDKR